MRTWVLAVLLAVLPLQFSWASAAVYCLHQGEAVARHVGHHEHHHVAAAEVGKASDAGSKASPSALGGIDDDCGYCHLSGAKPLTVRIDASFGAAVHPLVFDAPGRYTSREPEAVERPNWHGLARSASPRESDTL